MLIRNGGFDVPDALFENAYLAYKSNPKSNQSTHLQHSGYLNLESIIYSGLELKINSGVIKKFLINFKNKIGLNQYIERLNEFIKWVGIQENNPNYMDEILREDQGDCEALKKKLASYKVYYSNIGRDFPPMKTMFKKLIPSSNSSPQINKHGLNWGSSTLRRATT